MRLPLFAIPRRAWINACSLAAALAAGGLLGCEPGPGRDGTAAPASTVPATAGPTYVLMKTDRGDIALELDVAKAPVSVRNFREYLNAGFYDGTVFHRCSPGFVVQGGGYDTAFREKATRSPITNEWTNGVKNLRGTVSMARGTAPDSATSQFFVNLADNAGLDGANGQAGSAVFGRVVRGMDVLDAVAASPTGDKAATNLGGRATVLRNVPMQAVTILSAKEASAAEAIGTGAPAPASKSPQFSIETIQPGTAK